METSHFDRAIIMIGTGTLLRRRKQMGGAATRSLKTRRRR
jgi:hypothetical protein